MFAAISKTVVTIGFTVIGIVMFILQPFAIFIYVYYIQIVEKVLGVIEHE